MRRPRAVRTTRVKHCHDLLLHRLAGAAPAPLQSPLGPPRAHARAALHLPVIVPAPAQPRPVSTRSRRPRWLAGAGGHPRVESGTAGTGSGRGVLDLASLEPPAPPQLARRRPPSTPAAATPARLREGKGCPAAVVLAGRAGFRRPAPAAARRRGVGEGGGGDGVGVSARVARRGGDAGEVSSPTLASKFYWVPH
ncbi:hypothetical protein PVAP13_9NG316446 [Panicum virgatum]|uniref:Uncharacterized protein n=1 Tax=Panicum virgatum TaxID=38727 RepID=A0A8T0MSI4_PANVG|nr:hypothetical protein PVAP13_9NG316446 [Panicum virgatum]